MQRRHPDLNRGMEVLQTSALPLGYAAGTCRAGDRARTGDPNLGKVVLYQLSYTRIMATHLGRVASVRNYSKSMRLVKQKAAHSEEFRLVTLEQAMDILLVFV